LGLNQLEANINVPLRRIVVEWAFNEAAERNACVLLEICVDNQQENTSVEELSGCDTIGDGRQLLALSLLADPVYQEDDHSLEDQVDNNNDECDAASESL